MSAPTDSGRRESPDSASAAGWPGTAKDTSTIAGSPKTVKIDRSAGYVRRRARLDRRRARDPLPGAKPKGTWHQLAGSTLELNGTCGNQCIVSYTVTVPERTEDVTGKMG
ncbi:hypothetical protein [Amycolatopsis rubida]|uniref:hypothetical protein n=1 Tax=Amycolatopsis rubida TaxID=112413 RepID=UPI000B874AD7|nr:hypothetical protein [Amycolatopsis rubida]